jgi:hypothetical protein
MGGFITFTTLEYRICVRSVSFYVSDNSGLAEIGKTTEKLLITPPPMVFGVYGTNDNINFTRLSTIDLNLPKTSCRDIINPDTPNYNYYYDNVNQDVNVAMVDIIQGYVTALALPFAVYNKNDSGLQEPSVFYRQVRQSSNDTLMNQPRTFTFANTTCYSAYMLKHLPDTSARIVSSAEAFGFYLTEIEWG